jgi:simple sugar transport system ATP-binding protein
VGAESAQVKEFRMSENLIELRNVSKSYGKVRALDDVSIHIGPSEVVALLGDNGAGKSTMIKVMSGVHGVDTGEIIVHGKPVLDWSVAAARSAGIETVYQDRALCEQQTITRNIFMGRHLTGFMGLIDEQRERAEAERLMRSIGFTSKVFSPDTPVALLSGGERQGVAIARSLYFEARLLILDEPTTALSLTESEKVFNIVRLTKERNCSVLFISHNIYHAYDVSDRFVILDRGHVVMEVLRSQLPAADMLVQQMQDIARVGKEAAAHEI